MSRNQPTTSIGLQLYSLDESSETLPDSIRRAGEFGYRGVEFADRIHEADVRAVRSALAESGIDPVAAHVSLSRLESDLGELVELYTSVDCTRLVIPHIGSTHFVTRDRIDALAERLLRISDRLTDHGLELLVHNTRAMHFPPLDRYRLDALVDVSVTPQGAGHYAAWALDEISPRRLRGETAFERLVERTAPEVTFEIDTKEVRTAGRDLAAVLDLVAGRVQAMHLSNATRTQRFPPAYRGSGLANGLVDVEASLRTAVDRDIEWVIVESEDAGETLTETTEAFERALSELETAPDRGDRGHRPSLGFGHATANP